jgi:hypothetical protein
MHKSEHPAAAGICSSSVPCSLGQVHAGLLCLVGSHPRTHMVSLRWYERGGTLHCNCSCRHKCDS